MLDRIRPTKIVIPDDYPPLIVDSLALRDLFDYPNLNIRIFDTHPKPPDLLERIHDAHIVVLMHPSTAMSGEVIRACRNLQHIAIWGIAVDNVDFEQTARLGVVVTHTPRQYIESVSEHTLALILALTRRIPELDDRVRNGDWPGSVLTQLSGKTLGIVGTSLVGRRLAKICAAIGMEILFTDSYGALNQSPRSTKVDNITLVDFDELLRRADVVSLHAERDEIGVIKFDRDTFARMKQTAYFVNTSAARMVNEDDLAEALRNETIMGAALDVFSSEPIERNNPLLELPNAILTPHIGLNTKEATESGLRDLVNNITSFLKGKIVNRVDAAPGYS